MQQKKHIFNIYKTQAMSQCCFGDVSKIISEIWHFWVKLDIVNLNTIY